MQDLAYELPRIHLPRTPVNRVGCLGGSLSERAPSPSMGHRVTDREQYYDQGRRPC
jgi:hypothetical protein